MDVAKDERNLMIDRLASHEDTTMRCVMKES